MRKYFKLPKFLLFSDSLFNFVTIGVSTGIGSMLEFLKCSIYLPPSFRQRNPLAAKVVLLHYLHLFPQRNATCIFLTKLQRHWNEFFWLPTKPLSINYKWIIRDGNASCCIRFVSSWEKNIKNWSCRVNAFTERVRKTSTLTWPIYKRVDMFMTRVTYFIDTSCRIILELTCLDPEKNPLK